MNNHISNFINIPIFDEKELSQFQKKVIVQNEVWDLIAQEDVRILNRSRYITYLTRFKMHHSDTSLASWIKESNKKKIDNKEWKKIAALDKRSYGVLTCHLKTYQDFEYIRSVVQDKINRKESPTLYILSLNSWQK